MPPATKTESRRSNLIDSLLESRKRCVNPPQVAFDRAQADFELIGDLALRNTVEPMPAEDGRRAGAKSIESLGHQLRPLPTDQVPLGRWGIGNARPGAVVHLAPGSLPPLCLSRGAEAIDHQGVGGAEQVGKGRCDRTGVPRRDLQPD